MPLVYACIAPHGGIIPGLEGAEGCAQTTAAMDELGRRMEAARPETVVVVTPHGVRVDGALAISMSERAMGSLDEPATEERVAFSVRVDLAVDRDFSRALLDAVTLASVPAAGVHYGATSGAGDCYPLDWGAVIPLHFLGARGGAAARGHRRALAFAAAAPVGGTLPAMLLHLRPQQVRRR